MQIHILGYTYSNCNEARSASTTINCTGSLSLKSFRTVDGTCNNLQNPTWGSSNTPLRRIAGIRKSV